jgi:uncharacterized RDD family membrane protein YckC
MLDLPTSEARPATIVPHASSVGRSASDRQVAGVGQRGLALGIDIIILALLNGIIIYFTMQICGLTAREISLLPKAPLLAFLLFENGGYLVAFTATGQTPGKMAAGIRVVPATGRSRMSLRRSMLRTLAWVLLAVPGGLGFTSVLFNRDRRGLHDHFAGTRVVRVSPA